MWCIQEINDEYRKRMYDILDLYEKPYDHFNPVIGVDEKPKQLLEDSRTPITMKPTCPEKTDYEYIRRGKINVFVAVDFKGGKRYIKVTKRRTKQDFAKYIKHLVNVTFKNAKTLHIVLDNLNTHFLKSFYETFEKEEADLLLSKIKFHYTPTHASWLNIAEIEINVMDIECIGRRIKCPKILRNEINEWMKKRNHQRKIIDWRFTKNDADRKLSKYYVNHI